MYGLVIFARRDFTQRLSESEQTHIQRRSESRDSVCVCVCVCRSERVIEDLLQMATLPLTDILRGAPSARRVAAFLIDFI